MFTLIVAMDRKGAIGKNGNLPWSLPSDLKHFKEYTKGKKVLMGYQTALSIGRALPDRTNMVLSRRHDAPFPGQIHFNCIGDVLDFHVQDGFPEIVVCGGSQIYDAMLPYTSKLVVTLVDVIVPSADTFFTPLPDIEATKKWNLMQREFHYADAKHAHDFSIRTYHHNDFVPPTVRK